MKYLIFFPAIHGAAAKTFATPLRHRRHTVLLRETEAWLNFANGNAEPCDCALLMLDSDDEVPGELVKAYGDAEIELKQIRPGDPVWEPSEDEARAMGELNQLRHDAALLGIEVDPAHTAGQLAEMISVKEREAADASALEEERAKEIEAEAEKARLAREGGKASPPDGGAAGADGGGASADAAATGAGEADGAGSATTEPAAPLSGASDEAVANADALVKLAGVDHSSPEALRAFAREHGVPLSPNKNIKPEKLLAAIRVKLGG